MPTTTAPAIRRRRRWLWRIGAAVIGVHDGVHLNEHGCRVAAGYIAEFLAREVYAR